MVYLSQFFLFIDNNRDFHQERSSKSLKITKLTSRWWKTDEFRRSWLTVAVSLNFRILCFCDLFFLSTTIGTFINTIVVSQLKWLKLHINNEKLMNLGHLSSMSLLARISVSSIVVVLSDILAWVCSRSWPFCLAHRVPFSLGYSRSYYRRSVFIVSRYIWPEFQ